MRQEIFICDNCRKVLSKNGVGKPHLSIVFGDYSGWVKIRDELNISVGSWKYFKRVSGVK